jgi:hypothetical protein
MQSNGEIELIHYIYFVVCVCGGVGTLPASCVEKSLFYLSLLQQHDFPDDVPIRLVMTSFAVDSAHVNEYSYQQEIESEADRLTHT